MKFTNIRIPSFGSVQAVPFAYMPNSKLIKIYIMFGMRFNTNTMYTSIIYIVQNMV